MGAATLLLAIGGASGAAVAFLYNRLVRLRNAGDNAWSDISVQLERRHDLIPNLVATVRGYAGHERRTLEEVVAARSRAREAVGASDRSGAERALGRSLAGVFAVAEAYPELRADRAFRDLQSQLASVEDDLQNARRYYNAIVRDYNTACESIPGNLVAALFRFRIREFFQLDDPDERPAPRVVLAS